MCFVLMKAGSRGGGGLRGLLTIGLFIDRGVQPMAGWQTLTNYPPKRSNYNPCQNVNGLLLGYGTETYIVATDDGISGRGLDMCRTTRRPLQKVSAVSKPASKHAPCQTVGLITTPFPDKNCKKHTLVPR